MRIKLTACAVIGAWVLTGCSSMAPIAATPASPQQAVAQVTRTVDYARVAAIEKNAAYVGVQVIWLRPPELTVANR